MEKEIIIASIFHHSINSVKTGCYIHLSIKISLEFLHEICFEDVTTRDRARLKRIRMVIGNFPSEMIEIAASYNENVNYDLLGQKHNLIKGAA
jgi:hypothetical protein